MALIMMHEETPMNDLESGATIQGCGDIKATERNNMTRLQTFSNIFNLTQKAVA